TGSSQETGNFYGAALGNLALQVQNAVVSDPAWFSNSSADGELNLANMGVKTDGIPANVRSYLCKISEDSTARMQITWIDGRDENDKFLMKGTGSDSATLMSALRARVSAN